MKISIRFDCVWFTILNIWCSCCPDRIRIQLHRQTSMMVLSQVGWNNNNEDNNNSIKKDILRTPPSEHGHSRCMCCIFPRLLFFSFSFLFFDFIQLFICFVSDSYQIFLCSWFFNDSCQRWCVVVFRISRLLLLLFEENRRS